MEGISILVGLGIIGAILFWKLSASESAEERMARLDRLDRGYAGGEEQELQAERGLEERRKREKQEQERTTRKSMLARHFEQELQKAREEQELKAHEKMKRMEAERRLATEQRMEAERRLVKEAERRLAEELATEQRMEAERRLAKEAERRLAEELATEHRRKEELREQFPRIIETAFLVKSCPRCHENQMGLVSISPNAKSIQYRCEICGKVQRAAAGSPEALKIKELVGEYDLQVERLAAHARLQESLQRPRRGAQRVRVKAELPLYFVVPEAMMPYEKTTRETITKAMRTEVYRRDNGQCVECGSKEQLHFDHILPVAKGGTTAVCNLQLLCQSCNLAKGARI